MELEWLLDRSQVDYHICRATVHYVSNNLRIKTEPVTFGADETVTVRTDYMSGFKAYLSGL